MSDYYNLRHRKDLYDRMSMLTTLVHVYSYRLAFELHTITCLVLSTFGAINNYVTDICVVYHVINNL